jgi:hypothetical protein
MHLTGAQFQRLVNDIYELYKEIDRYLRINRWKSIRLPQMGMVDEFIRLYPFIAHIHEDVKPEWALEAQGATNGCLNVCPKDENEFPNFLSLPSKESILCVVQKVVATLHGGLGPCFQIVDNRDGVLDIAIIYYYHKHYFTRYIMEIQYCVVFVSLIESLFTRDIHTYYFSDPYRSLMIPFYIWNEVLNILPTICIKYTQEDELNIYSVLCLHIHKDVASICMSYVKST